VIVADASVVVELLLGTEMAPRAAARILAPGESVHVPHLLDAEVAQVVRRYVMTGVIEARRGKGALADLLDLPLHRHPHAIFLRRAWELRRSTSAYDAIYVALAEALAAPLLTRDRRLARAHGHRARVEIL
jgi:predicted nucleic acid-binding protein